MPSIRRGTFCCPEPYKDGGQAVNAWEITGLKTARSRGWHAQRPARRRPRLDGRDRLAVEGAQGTGQVPGPAAGRRPVADQLLPRRVGRGRRGRQVPQGAEAAGAQLGLVAAGGDRHAPAGAVGHRPVQHRRRRAPRRSTPTRPSRPATTCTAFTTPSASTTSSTIAIRPTSWAWEPGWASTWRARSLEATRGTFEASVELRQPGGRRSAGGSPTTGGSAGNEPGARVGGLRDKLCADSSGRAVRHRANC